MLEITTSLDWPKVEKELRHLGNMMPMFGSDVRKLLHNISSMVSELSNLEVTARNTKSKSSISKCQSKAEEINKEIKKFEKLHLMSMLSR